MSVPAQELWCSPDPETKGLWRAQGIEAFEPLEAVPDARVLLVDHYDSFSYNLVQLCLQLGAQVRVVRSDRVASEGLLALGASHWILSPGPGHPGQAGVRPELWSMALRAKTPPVLGVCLGHQGLCLAMGARVVGAQEILHGKKSVVEHDASGLFAGCPASFSVVRYHSLVVDEASLPDAIVPCAWVQAPKGGRGELMGVRHRALPLHGVQFHPESVASECGAQLMQRFLSL